MKKMDMLVVQNDKIDKENSGLLAKVDAMMVLQQVYLFKIINKYFWINF